jgi:hypothetical protein
MTAAAVGGLGGYQSFGGVGGDGGPGGAGGVGTRWEAFVCAAYQDCLQCGYVCCLTGIVFGVPCISSCGSNLGCTGERWVDYLGYNGATGEQGLQGGCWLEDSSAGEMEMTAVCTFCAYCPIGLKEPTL